MQLINNFLHFSHFTETFFQLRKCSELKKMVSEVNNLNFKEILKDKFTNCSIENRSSNGA